MERCTAAAPTQLRHSGAHILRAVLSSARRRLLNFMPPPLRKWDLQRTKISLSRHGAAASESARSAIDLQFAIQACSSSNSGKTLFLF